MGIFNYYLKEGPGVDKDAPKKKGAALFFEILFRKFFELIKANSLYFIVSLPAFLIILIFIAPMYTGVFFDLGNMDDNVKVLLYLVIANILFNFIGSGPASAGYSFVTRCFVRSQPVWIASDGFDKFRENFKQSIFLVVLDMAVSLILGIAIGYYGSGTSFLYIYLKFLMMFLLIIYMISRVFAYQIMVTYDCKFRDILKNSIVFTFVKLPMCVLLAVMETVICYLLYLPLGFLGIFVYIFIGMMIVKFPLEFYAIRVIEKNIEAQEKNMN